MIIWKSYWEGITTSNLLNKPKLTSFQLIEKMRDEKGITFNIMSESDAEKYLRESNNYLRTAAYRKNFSKHSSGEQEGKYIDLDFAYLAELSSLDMHLREILFDMCVDVEHALKVSLVTAIEDNPLENGYNIVTKFLAAYPHIESGIAYKSGSAFTGGLIDKYFSIDKSSGSPKVTNIDCPAWVLTELLSFADFVCFYNYYYSSYGQQNQLKYNIINPVRNLRNACGHNTCLLLDLRPQIGTTKPNTTISKYLSTIPSIGKRERQKKLSCRPIFEICCLIYAHNIYVSKSVRTRQFNRLKDFIHGRMVKNSSYFKNNLSISTTMDFLTKLIDATI